MVSFISYFSIFSVLSLAAAAGVLATPPTAAKALVAVAGTLAHVDSLGSAAIAPDTPLARKRQNVNFADATITTTINTLNGNTLGPSSQPPAKQRMVRQLSPANAAVIQEAGALVAAAANVQKSQALAALA